MKTGGKNVAIGYEALKLGTGHETTAIGYKAGAAITTGNNNTLLGFQAGDTLTTGAMNTILGHDADTSTNNAINQIVIGKDAIGLDEVKLGNTYAIVISTNSGLWRYLIGDTIAFTSLSPFRIKIIGPVKH